MTRFHPYACERENKKNLHVQYVPSLSEMFARSLKMLISISPSDFVNMKRFNLYK